MDWLKRVNEVMDYIETNLEGEIDTQEVARISAFPEHQFQRMFGYIADMSLSEYIRRRRLTKAAFDLLHTEDRVMDIAIRYGYDSPISFARAFRKLHGVSPNEARKESVFLKSYPKISFRMMIKGDVEMDYRIEQKEGFRVFGVEKVVYTENEKNLVDIPTFWRESFQNGTIKNIQEQLKTPCKEGKPGLMDIFAIMCHRETEPGSFPYMIGAFLEEETASEKFQVAEVGSYQWAIFRTEDYKDEEMVEKIQTLWKRIFAEWFPTSGYEHDNGPELEMYGGVGNGMEYCEVWIPVRKQQ